MLLRSLTVCSAGLGIQSHHYHDLKSCLYSEIINHRTVFTWQKVADTVQSRDEWGCLDCLYHFKVFENPKLRSVNTARIKKQRLLLEKQRLWNIYLLISTSDFLLLFETKRIWFKTCSALKGNKVQGKKSFKIQLTNKVWNSQKTTTEFQLQMGS